MPLLAEKIKAYSVALKNVLLCLNINKISLVKKPRKLLYLTQLELFYSKMAMGKRGLPLKNIHEVFPIGSNTIELNIVISNKWFSTDSSYTKDLITLCTICKIINPYKIFEIGTFDGFTAYHFALNSSERTEVYTLDLPKTYCDSELAMTIIDRNHIDSYRGMSKYIFSGTPAERKINCLFGDSAKYDFTQHYKQIDVFFIDGAHSYEYVRSDSINALNCVRKGGVIIWHDYGRYGVNGVAKWLHELRKKNEVFSVPGSSLAFMVVQ